jgi:hypothetical protein
LGWGYLITNNIGVGIFSNWQYWGWGFVVTDNIGGGDL